MAIELRECSNEKEWDNLLEQSSFATVFHKWAFLKIMEKHSKVSFLGKKRSAKLYPIIGIDGERIIGLCPIFTYSSGFIRYACSPAQGSIYQGPLMLDSEEIKQRKREYYADEFQKALDNFLESKIKANLIRFNTPPNASDSRIFSWSGYSVKPMYTYELYVNGDMDEAFNCFDRELRRMLKKSGEEITIETGSEKDLESLYSLIDARYAEQHLGVGVDWQYLADIYKSLYPQNLRVFVARGEGRVLGGVVTLIYRGKVLLWVGMPKNSFKGVYPNDLLLWRIMLWAKENGFSVVENSSANSHRLCKYKSKFNPKISIYFSCEKKTGIAKLLYSLNNLVRALR